MLSSANIFFIFYFLFFTLIDIATPKHSFVRLARNQTSCHRYGLRDVSASILSFILFYLRSILSQSQMGDHKTWIANEVPVYCDCEHLEE